MNEEKQISKREKLVHESDVYKEAIIDQVEDIKSSMEQWLKTVLVIGGTIVISYTFVRSLIHKKERSDENENLPARTHAEKDSIANRIMEQIAFFLMSVAREKLMEFLKKYGKNDTKDPQ
jgi:hypothetical protein